MPFELNDQTYYWTTEACSQAGISRNTFLRWVREGNFRDVELRDRRGWRLFTEQDLQRLKKESSRTRHVEYSERSKHH